MTAQGISGDYWNMKDTIVETLPYTQGLDDLNIAKMLERANRRVRSQFGKYVEERLYPDKEDQLEYDLRFARLIDFHEVRRFDELVDSSNYTVDKEAGTISFDSSWADDNLDDFQRWRVVAEYTPYAFVDLELYYAIEELLSMTVVQLNDEEEENKLKQFKKLRKERVKEINRQMPPPDDESGDTLGANRRRRWHR